MIRLLNMNHNELELELEWARIRMGWNEVRKKNLIEL